MLFMVVEHFRNGDAAAVYQRYRERGRMMPEGLEYVDSWIEADFNKCFQLMKCQDPDLLRQWTAQWDDLVEFEIIPVITSKQAAALQSGHASPADDKLTNPIFDATT